jgi:hypothetical protein
MPDPQIEFVHQGVLHGQTFSRTWAALPPGKRRCLPKLRPTVGSIIDPAAVEARMQTIKFIHWQDGDAFIGYFLDYPDYWTQGDSLDELKENLVDLYRDLTSGELPGIRKIDELVIP